jgi:hypothetical protein
MTSQIRYRTLVNNLARIYDASDETRTGCLQEGLTKVLETINPSGSDEWQQVKVDSMRLLRVWRAREDCQGDSTLADQILEALSDFAAEDVPRLEISERPFVAAVAVTPPSEPVVAALPKPVPVEKALTHDEAAAIEAALAAIEDEEDAEAEVAEPLLSEDEDEEDTEEEEEVEVEPEVIVTVAVAPASVASETTEEEEEEEEVVEPESDSEDEEAEEEEEEGVEVEKRTIRGREYWLSSDGTLYAILDDDEIGEEVGRINKEGRPVFLAPK